MCGWCKIIPSWVVFLSKRQEADRGEQMSSFTHADKQWLLSELIVVIVDISTMSVRARVTRPYRGVFIIVVLTPVVIGACVVHPVRQVSLQPLVRKNTTNL